MLNSMKKFDDLPSGLNLQESLPKLNAAYYKFRGIYQSGKRYNAREWLKIMEDLLDSVG